MWFAGPVNQAASRSIDLKPAPNVSIRFQAIEDIRLGDRVAGMNPTGEYDEQFGRRIEARNWRRVVLRAPNLDGTQSRIEYLRPAWWLVEHEIRVGDTVRLNIPEAGIHGAAEIVDIGSCPEIEDGPGEVVIGLFHHRSKQVINLSIEGQSQPIGVTPNHPVWSEERHEFVEAGELHEGELVRTIHGLAHINSISSRGPPEDVYNLEVLGEHVYHVSRAGLLVHNYDETDGDESDKKGELVYEHYDPETGEVIYIGITNDFERRRKEHAKDKGKRGVMRAVTDKLSHDKARTIEASKIRDRIKQGLKDGTITEDMSITEQLEGVGLKNLNRGRSKENHSKGWVEIDASDLERTGPPLEGSVDSQK